MSKKISFEDGLEKLREMSEKIKSPDVSLEESIKIFEEGMEYYKELDLILKDAKQKIEEFNIEQEG